MPYNPNNWPGWIEVIQGWWHGETPVGAVLMAFLVAILRIAYTGGGRKKIVLEGLLCAALALTVASGMEYAAWPKSLSVAVGGSIGFIGVDALRAFVMRFIGNRLGTGNDNNKR